MTLEQPPKNLRIYTIIWLGQTASLIGSNMTNFALLIWAWQRTGEATPLALLSFFMQVPIIIASLFAGILVDRHSRKRIMMSGDIIAAICTLVILILFLTNQLAIWHLYFAGVFVGLFGYFQGLAFSTSQSLLVPKQHYIRVGAMGSMQTFGSGVLAPALAGVLYPIVGLRGILIIDLMTFSVAFATLARVQIPQPSAVGHTENPWQQMTFGFRYLIQRPSLMGLQLFAMSFIFFDSLSAVSTAMILARSSNNTSVLGSVEGAVGLGGLTGAVLLGLWGGPKRRIHGLLIGRAIVFSFEMLLGLMRLPSVWIGANFAAGLFKPLANSCEETIWISKVEPSVQGRVFAANWFLISIISSLGLLLAGPLADFVFEPVMKSGGLLAPILGNVFGTDRGSGMALQFALFSFIVVLICLGSYAFSPLRNIEKILPDHDVG